MSSHRLPRFQRAKPIPAIQLTERDRDIIRAVFRFRFLRSSHVVALMTGSRQGALRRLGLLYHHGFLDRPRAQIDYYRQGSQPMVYGLGNKGMALLEEIDAIPHSKLDWTARNRSITRYFMDHTLAVADVLIAIESSCRRHSIELIQPSEPVKWNVSVRHHGVTHHIGVAPDRVFGLKDKQGIRWFFLEADRATMPVERGNLKQTSIFKKLLAYQETWSQGILKERFPRFRVLTVTTSPERIRNLLDACHRIPRGHGLFLFARQASFGKDDALTSPLLDGHDNMKFLLE